MPEQREGTCMALQIRSAIQDKNLGPILGIHADPTASERKKAPGGSCSAVKLGLVTRLGPHCRYKRGTNGAQTPLWPEVFRVTRRNPVPPPISTLSLRGPEAISATARGLDMELGPLNLYLAFLTHTNVQLYTWKQFLQSIAKLPVKVRRFSIRLAFEFQDYFLAFVTLDNVFQPNWYLPSGPIPFELSIPDPVHTWLTFLDQVTQAIMARVNSPSCQRDQVLAIQVVRDMKIFHGIGIYVGLETFVMAGISPFLTEAEVFDCPSRTARLCLAYWEFVNMSYSPELWEKLLRPAIHRGVLAPTVKQRKNYADWLVVYGKDRIKCTFREASLIDKYIHIINSIHQDGNHGIFHVRTGHEASLFDVFEPARIRKSLKPDSQPDLGHLVFGNRMWVQLGRSVPSVLDPLTHMFQSRGLGDGAPTYLLEEVYTSLFDDSRAFFRPTYSYHDRHQIWTMTPVFPPNSFPTSEVALNWENEYSMTLQEVLTKQAKQNSRSTSDQRHCLSSELGDKQERKVLVLCWPPYSSRFRIVEAHERESKLFKNIVSKNTTDVAIGPLEYCGNGRMVKDSHGKLILTVCWYDPGSLSKGLVSREY
ncbi:hypothetical protein D9758_017248 [Tetrapyrgos nigripes]|uniref:Uncharacterized protein n=1 Tax=Tetrapyrgos nigripes TaxID=182062 RepID=A0A8H5C461_9AGAR|nr:hypothetical protein D9758_017248 [Tetrapyrgos nigripes]